MSFSAIIPAADMDAANAALDSQGFGPSNFSVPVYDGARPGYATLHAWTDAAFQAAVEAISGVTVSDIEGTPQERVNAAIAAVDTDAGYAGDPKPLEGQVTPGLHTDDEGTLWYVIQPYDTAVWSDPDAIPALIRRCHVPGANLPWVQPIDQFDAYYADNPFTGNGDRVTHPDRSHNTSQPGAAWIWESKINANTTEPGQDGTLHRWWEPIEVAG